MFCASVWASKNSLINGISIVHKQVYRQFLFGLNQCGFDVKVIQLTNREARLIGLR